MKQKIIALILLTISISIYAGPTYQDIPGISVKNNQLIKHTLEKYENSKDRKVATFDADGTVIGQVPYYLADEALYDYALNHTGKKLNLIRNMTSGSNTSNDYLTQRVDYLSGLTPQEISDLGNKTFNKYFKGKIYPNIKVLIQNLKKYGFEIWVVSASPELLYQGVLSRELGIPVTHIIGVKSVVSNGVTTNKIVLPISQDEGKADAIETIIKVKPILAVGNSTSDVEMLNYSSALKVIVNPNDSEKEDYLGGKTLKEYAESQNWIIAKANDTVDVANYKDMASYKFHIKQNEVNNVQTYS
ncbi:MAG: phosphoserine phosphatase [Francisella sp.]|jgi:phosphoserine phosphatase